ncbi:hypothetical protein [Kibdelosporangium phytohabitans]|uniref:hypothetical protein n=1 Tax=Kibdelosporangium phytohabitans TaxID=860235 RepID=UPI001CEF19A4|nr:hypothetical protein [Kibdelosporangium phytohabitans]
MVSRSTPERFDWSDDTTWEPVLQDVEAVYVVNEGTDRLPEFTELAAGSGVRRLVLLSARVWAEMGRDLADERVVEQSGAEWTIHLVQPELHRGRRGRRADQGRRGPVGDR